MKRVLLLLLTGLAALAVILAGCQETTPPNEVAAPPDLDKLIGGVCYPDTTELMAGQTTDVGSLIIWNDENNLYVRYQVDASCTFGTLRLWAGTDTELLPKSLQGVPVPAQFPHQADASGLAEYTFAVPLDSTFPGVTSFCGVRLYVFANAELMCGGATETAWGGNIGKGIANAARWYYFYQYRICCGDSSPSAGCTCETAYAKFEKEEGGYIWTTDSKSNPESYPSLNLTKNRWGWAGDLAEGTYVVDLWAGAGLNDISNGTNAGTVTVEVTATTVTVTYDMAPEIKLSEVHIYVGDEPVSTIAPGQYGHTAYFLPKVQTYSATFDVTDANGDGKFWVVAHSVVCIPNE